MTLTHIAVFSALALLNALLLPPRWRSWLLLVASLVAVYLLQPRSPVRFVDFILPTATLSLVVFVWAVTQAERRTRENLIALGLVVGVIVVMSLNRYIHPDFRLTPSRPPATVAVLLALLLLSGLLLGLLRLVQQRRTALVTSSVVFIVALFVILKTSPLADSVSRLLREGAGQDVTLAAGAVDLAWLGFSYAAFRLLHILFDWRSSRLPETSLRVYLTYAVFFPAFTAGPIDRIERHLRDEADLPGTNLRAPSRWVAGVTRISIGIFKKFVLADSLALFALNEVNALQVTSAGGTWLLLYAYALRLFLDFSGYTDIAIGLAWLFGIHLPENFDRPYLKNNITAFWQSWHMTLSQWVRFYVFSPLSRTLLRRNPKPSPLLVVFSAQLATMIVIGLWHGVTWNFLVWGGWHGLGLFVHKVWSDRTRGWYLDLKSRPRLLRLWTIAGVVITFHFVTLSWVWFALPDFDMALAVLVKLFGGDV